LYAMSDQSTLASSTSKLFGYHVSTGSTDASYQCVLLANTITGKVSGSPAILTEGSAEYALVADQTGHRLFAMNGVFGTGCSGVATTGVLPGNTVAWTGVVNSPSVLGATNAIFVAHGTSGLAKLSFSSGAFTADTEAASAPSLLSAPAILGSTLFLADRNPAGRYYSFNPSTMAVGWTGPQLGDALTSSPVVSTSYVFGTAAAGDGKLHAFSRSDGTETFNFPAGSGSPNDIGALSPVALGSDNVIYVSDDKPNLYAALYTSGLSADFAPGWGQSIATAFHGSATTPDTTLDSVTTEPTLDSSGVLYFGTQGGKVYALITDSGGPLAPSAGSTWPRVGYDNCNSSNTAFNCQ
jgi:hypothetical protein